MVGGGGRFVNFEEIFSFYGFGVSLELIFEVTNASSFAIRGSGTYSLAWGKCLLRPINLFSF